MVMGFTELTTERPDMEALATKQESKTISSFDRCDQCGGQAFVLVAGISGELTFCGHHYAKIEKDPQAIEKLKAFAYEIVDDRYKLQEFEDKRVIGD